MTEITLEGYQVRYTTDETDAQVLVDGEWVDLPMLSTPSINVDQLDLSHYLGEA